jgi:hypothetical protein
LTFGFEHSPPGFVDIFPAGFFALLQQFFYTTATTGSLDISTT